MRDLEINGLTGEEETRRQYEYIEKARQYVAQKEKEAGRKLTCCVHTFGCQMNARDSEKLLGILTDIGYVETEDEHADFVIYNTCTVRENANNKVYGRLGVLQHYKKKICSIFYCGIFDIMVLYMYERKSYTLPYLCV